jgi:putative MFS transporter
MTMQAQDSAITQREVVSRLERLPLSSWQVKTRIIVGTATFFDAFDALAIAFILPAIIPLCQMKPADIGWLISMGYVGQLVGALAGGWLAERFGRRPVIVASILWFGLLSIACAFAWDYNSLLVMRTLQGLGLGAEVPVAATYISELAKARNRGRFVLLFELVFPVGIFMAALLGRWIVPHLGWQYMFYVGGLPALLALFMMRMIPDSPRWLASRGRMDAAKTTLVDIENRDQRAAAARRRHERHAVVETRKLERPVPGHLREAHHRAVDLLVRDLPRQLRPDHMAAERLSAGLQASDRAGAQLRTDLEPSRSGEQRGLRAAD